MPPQYLIIGLSQLTEPIIPSYVVTLEHYKFNWQNVLEEAIILALKEKSELSKVFFEKHLNYNFSEWLFTELSEREEEGRLGGEYWQVYDAVSKTMLKLTWVYFEHFFNHLNGNLGRYKSALDSVTVHSYLESTHDVILEFKWDLTRLPYSPVENYSRSQR